MLLSDRARKSALWDDFCCGHALAARSVPLFACDAAGYVVARPYGKDRRLIIQRSPEMEHALMSAVEMVTTAQADGADEAEGVLYLMFRQDGEQVIPLYIGRAGKYGVHGGLSANLAGIRVNKGKFARWGSNYAYHIGDLSAVVCPGHHVSKCIPKYRRWADRLFVEAPSSRPQLRHEVRFCATVWGPDCQSIWREYGRTSLSFEEYLLIGVASDLFPDDLLNNEGVNRPVAGAVAEQPG